MAESTSKNAVSPQLFMSLDEFHADAMQAHALDTIAEAQAEDDDLFLAAEDESLGFAFLEAHGPRAIQAFKLLEIAHSVVAGETGTSELNTSEWGLLMRMIGPNFADEAADAYEDCKLRTRNLEDMHDLDSRVTWRLIEFIHLFEHVMLYGARMGRITRNDARHVLHVLVRDYGEYFGLLCDDAEGPQAAQVARLAHYLSQFRASSLFSEQLPVDCMTRLPLADPRARALLDYEIARGIDAHPIAVKERVLRGDDQGHLNDTDPIEFLTHKLDVRYAYDLSREDLRIINAILPIFAISHFDGFGSLQEVEAFIARRREELETAEQQCFALLQCLKHYGGQVPARMKEFDAHDAMRAAQRVYRDRSKAPASRSTTLGGMLKDTVSGVFQAVVVKAVDFSWPENRAMYRLPGYPESVAFFAQNVTVGSAEPAESYVFLCHAHTDTDPRGDRPRMYEYQAIIGEGMLFDAHAAARDLFADAPAAFKRTLEVGPAALYAKDVVHPGEREASVDLEETKLLAAYVALHGGMQSWIGQRYVLSDEGADIFKLYPDVRAYVQRLSDHVVV